MALADRFRHWQQQPDEELVDYHPVDLLIESPEDSSPSGTHETTPHETEEGLPWLED
jgi:hypothetical protein